MKVEFRKLHRRLAPILFLPLLASALTGVTYRLGKSWFGIPNVVADILMIIHQGEYLGKQLVPIYIFLIALGLLGMSVTGLNLLDGRSSDVSSKQTKPQTRNIHRLLALILVLPLSISAETGVIYRLGKDWFGMSSEQAEFFLRVHQGLYLGATFSVFYVLLSGLGLVTLLIAGIKLMRLGSSSERSQALPSPAKTLSQSTLSNVVVSLRRKTWSAIALFLIVFFGLLYGVTSKILSKKYNALPTELKTQQPYSIHLQDLLIPLGIVGLVFGILAMLLAEKLIQNWRQQKEVQADLYDHDVAIQTLLKAIPDSMLRISMDGTCLSYMPPANKNKSFMLNGDILGKNVTEFLPLEIAKQLIKSAQLALQSGSTHVYQFLIDLDDEKQYQEARISAIGETESLIMIREFANLAPGEIEPKKLPPPHGETSVILVKQQELIQQLELTIEDAKKYNKNHVLCYLAVDQQETIGNNHGSQAGDNLLKLVGEKVNTHLPSTCLIARLDNNELALLLHNYSLEEASMLVDELRQGLNEFSFLWHGKEYPISVSIGLVEIDANSSDVIGVMSAADAACQIAKQKIISKAFW